MRRYRIKKYTLLTALWTVAFIFLWLLFSYWFVIRGRTAVGHNFTDDSILKSIFLGNYQGIQMLIDICAIPFLLSLKFIFFSDNTTYFFRFSSRQDLIKQNAASAVIVSMIFALLHETVNIIGCIIVFGYEMVSENNIILYSLFNTAAVFVYFLRKSFFLLLARTYISEKYAHYVVFILYFLEYQIIYNTFNELFWVPCDDVVVIGKLILEEINYSDVALVILRGVFLSAVVFLVALMRTEKRDVLANEKN
jgi:hypothetical protein